VAAVVTAVGTVLLFSTAYTSFSTASMSMSPTVNRGEHMLVRRTQDVHEGDIVVFDGAHSFDLDSPSRGRSYRYVERVIALGGRHLHETQTQVELDGRVLTEPYVAKDDLPPPFVDTFDVTIPRGRMWVLGDNRSQSADSRYHQNSAGRGTVPVSDVVGVVVAHGSRLTAYARVLGDAGVAGALAGVVVTGVGLRRRRTLVA